MLPIEREEFVDELRALPADRRAAFLAALYGYRGRQVDRTGSLVYIDGPNGSTIFVPRGNKQNEGENTDRIQTADVDAVLAFEEGSTRRNTEMAGVGRTDSGSSVPPGVERIEAADLHQAILYAINRTDCERLVNEFFSRSLSSFECTDTTRRRPCGGTTAKMRARRPKTRSMRGQTPRQIRSRTRSRQHHSRNEGRSNANRPAAASRV